MKYIKKFEREIVNDYLREILEYFFKQYELFKISAGGTYKQHSLDRAKTYSVPEFLYDEFCILHFFYNSKGWWNNYYDKAVVDFLKREIKKQTLESIINKFEEDINNYYLLKNVFDKRPKWNDSRSFNGINDSTVRYIFMLFYKAVNNAPQYIKDTNKYNL